LPGEKSRYCDKRHGQQADRGEAHCPGMVDGESGGGGGDAPEGGA